MTTYIIFHIFFSFALFFFIEWLSVNGSDPVSFAMLGFADKLKVIFGVVVYPITLYLIWIERDDIIDAMRTFFNTNNY